MNPGDNYTVSFDMKNVTGTLGFGIVSLDGNSLLKPEPQIVADGPQKFTLKIPAGVARITPIIYSSRGASSFALSHVRISPGESIHRFRWNNNIPVLFVNNTLVQVEY